MRKLAIATVAVVVIGLAGAGATFAGKDHRDGGRTFTVFAMTSPDRIAVLLVVPGKFSLGDRVVFSDDLFTARGGTVVGTDGAECTTVRVTSAATASGVLQCLVTFSLPGGQITTQALNTVTNAQFTTGTQTGAITGGTGKYRDAEGEFSVASSARPRRTSPSSSTTEAPIAVPAFVRRARAPHGDPDSHGDDASVARDCSRRRRTRRPPQDGRSKRG